jgi:hypothetical protein
VILSIDKSNFGKREKKILKVNVTDSLGQPLAASLSVAITSTEFASPTFTQASIKDWHANKNLSIQANSKVFTHPVEQSLSFKGVFFDERERPAYTKFQVFLDGYSMVLDMETDENGLFEIKGILLSDAQTVIFQAKNRKGDSYGSFKLYDLDQPTVAIGQSKAEPSIVDVGIPIYIQEMLAGATLLDEVTVEEKKEVRDRPMIYGKPTYEVPSEKLMLFATPTEFLMSLRGRVPSMSVTTGGTPRVKLRGGAASAQLGTEPMLMVNGQPMYGGIYEVLTTLNLLDIERVEVIPGIVSILGEFGRNGVISLIMKSYSSSNTNVVQFNSPSATNLVLEGFSYYNPIAFPDYESDGAEKLPKYDQRPTLYWNPMVTTDSETGMIEIPFFTNDVLAPIFINVEGITANGTPVRATYLMKP